MIIYQWNKLSFKGGIDTQYTLPRGTVEDVKREVKYMIDTLGYQGGYILEPSHNFQPDTPVENIIAMYEIGRNYKYGEE